MDSPAIVNPLPYILDPFAYVANPLLAIIPLGILLSVVAIPYAIGMKQPKQLLWMPAILIVSTVLYFLLTVLTHASLPHTITWI